MLWVRRGQQNCLNTQTWEIQVYQEIAESVKVYVFFNSTEQSSSKGQTIQKNTSLWVQRSTCPPLKTVKAEDNKKDKRL